MLKQYMLYSLHCDNCGIDLHKDNEDYSLAEKTQLYSDAYEADWAIAEDEACNPLAAYCTKCATKTYIDQEGYWEIWVGGKLVGTAINVW